MTHPYDSSFFCPSNIQLDNNMGVQHVYLLASVLACCTALPLRADYEQEKIVMAPFVRFLCNLYIYI